jgi:dTDP-4-dehydrorhamnose 3,5-epimerase
MIEGVMVKQLKVIPDERGRLMEILRQDDDIFMKFGQMYLTTGYPGVVKAWHYHKAQFDHFCVLKGMMKVVLLVYHGFKTISEQEALLINVPTEVYRYKDPDEFRVHPHDNDIPYSWERKDG